MNFLPHFNILADATAAPEGGGGLAGGLGGMGAFLPWILIFAIFYFIMIRPQQRRKRNAKK